MGNSPHILLIEDDEDDYHLTHDLLSEVFGRQLRFEWANTWRAGLEAISRGGHDVCLVDYRLGKRSGLDIIRDAVEQGSSTPFILLTGQDDREIDLEAMEAGAADYLVKGQISAPLLDRAVRYSIEQKKVETRLAKLAAYDALTGLANRTLYRSHLIECIAQAKRNDKVGALLLLDLDNFKDINDSLGHPVGDELLKEVSVRLVKGVRASDFVARLGGDEFAVIATNLDDTDGLAVLARKIIEQMVEPAVLDGWDVFTSTSIGITMFPQDSADPDQLLKNADMALYHAKNNGRGKFQFYNSELNARAQKRKEMEADLRQTLEEGGFTLHFQPKINLSDERVVGVETLLRWFHPEQGMIPPDDFIPVAEATGLIVPIGDWVLRAACAQHAAWREAGLPPIPVAVNLSAVQFKSPGLMDVVIQALGDSNTEPTNLELEITESMIMDNLDLTTEMLHRLHGLGVGLAIDDFGTGHSSLAYLKRFPMDRLKIDRSFVRDIVDDPADAAIATTIVTLAKHLNLGVVAEGVETESQLEILRRQGCEEAQGYFYSPPLPPKDFADWYRDYERHVEVQSKTISIARRAAASP